MDHTLWIRIKKNQPRGRVKGMKSLFGGKARIWRKQGSNWASERTCQSFPTSHLHLSRTPSFHPTTPPPPSFGSLRSLLINILSFIDYSSIATILPRKGRRILSFCGDCGDEEKTSLAIRSSLGNWIFRETKRVKGNTSNLRMEASGWIWIEGIN